MFLITSILILFCNFTKSFGSWIKNLIFLIPGCHQEDTTDKLYEDKFLSKRADSHPSVSLTCRVQRQSHSAVSLR